MFTGLIEEIGQLIQTRKNAKGASVKITAKKVLEGVRQGDSIAVDGVCLTVTGFDENGFEADVMPATYEQTRISQLQKGAKVHLERALCVGERLGGHFVSGHVDGMSKVLSLYKEGQAYRLRLERSQSFARHLVHKGSIAINGVSLTIDTLTDKYLEVSLVQHTQGETLLTSLKVGEVVNIESDMLIKYVSALIGTNKPESEAVEDSNGGQVTMSVLQSAGFL